MKSLKLKQGKEANPLRKHPWVFSGALEGGSKAEDGELVYLTDYKSDRLGFGHYHDGSIAIKMLSFGSEDYELEFWVRSLQNAFSIRKVLMTDLEQTNCYRWVNGEGDSLPGLIVDVYDGVIVIQCHTIGMHRNVKEISEGIKQVFDGNLKCIVDKSRESLPADYAQTVENKILYGEYEEPIVRESGHLFRIDCLGGQKTGFFLDQRENRKLLRHYAADRTVLNTYCYSGGFSMYALTGGAKEVDSVDSSKKAIGLLEQNLELNQLGQSLHRSLCADVHDFLKSIPSDHYDLMVLDPPAFAKSIAKKHAAVQAYKRINLIAIQKIKSGGVLFTFSCSQVVDEILFYNTIVSAGIESGRKIRVLHTLSQAADHPVSLFHSEGRYLKGLALMIF